MSARSEQDAFERGLRLGLSRPVDEPDENAEQVVQEIGQFDAITAALGRSLHRKAEESGWFR
jgi:hypothetical protein